MENRILKSWVDCFQEEDRNAFLSVYRVFEPLIAYYAAKLVYEDAKQDLTVFLLELSDHLHTKKFLCDSSCTLQRYMAVCIRNQYLSLSQKQQNGDTGRAELFEESGAVTPEFDEKIWMADLLRFLSQKQRTVLMYRYVYGYSDREISERLCISRQAVNRVRNRGLSTLRKAYDGTVC